MVCSRRKAKLKTRKGNRFSGMPFFCMTKDKKRMLLDYYAFLEEHRNKGYGSIFLQNMRVMEDFPAAIWV